MAKLYYGDTNNTAVEINLGSASGDYLPLNVTEDTNSKTYTEEIR